MSECRNIFGSGGCSPVLRIKSVVNALVLMTLHAALNFCLIGSVFAQNNVEIFFKDQNQYKDVVIARVIKADLIELESGEKIQLIGLKAPEAPRRAKEKPERDEYGFVFEPEASPLTPIEELAYNYVKDLLENKHVRLEFDTQKKDQDHHTFAYVFLLKDDLFANVEILRQGYADLRIQTPNTKYAEKLRAAYREAYKERRGLQNR